MNDDRTPDDELLAGIVSQWKAATPAPPDGLEQRILRAVRAEHEATRGATTQVTDNSARSRRAPRWFMPAAWPAPAWAAVGALATLLLVAALFAVRSATAPPAPLQAERLLVADALRDAEAAEREHARAIARLQETAQPTLALASDPRLPGEQAARLMMLSNRLRFLDQTIAEIQTFVRENPAHPGARTTLLAAYNEKTEVLRDVIALAEEIDS
ncbi:MAG: hypothetical protein PVJ49_17950 [Acidobacteriota bacterium]|jgi:hypothetical protein